MRAEQVEVGSVGVVGVDVEQAFDGGAVGRGIERRGDGVVEPASELGVDLSADGESEGPTTKQVVHGGVEPVTPSDPIGGVLPDLTDDVEIGVHRPHPLPKTLPESRCGDLGGHVESPSIDAAPCPVLAD